MSAIHKNHYIYKITCNVTNRFYIGMHSTNNLNDGYFGSGKILKRSLNKHGKNNHSFEILENLSDRKSLREREKEIINVDLLNEPLCMNLTIGGNGGSLPGKLNGKFGKKLSSDQKKKWINGYLNFLKENPEKAKEIKEKQVRTKIENNDGIHPAYFSGKTHTKASKLKMKNKAQLRKPNQNSQFGTCWIFNLNLNENKKIKNSQLSDYLLDGWIKGRKLK